MDNVGLDDCVAACKSRVSMMKRDSSMRCTHCRFLAYVVFYAANMRNFTRRRIRQPRCSVMPVRAGSISINHGIKPSFSRSRGHATNMSMATGHGLVHLGSLRKLVQDDPGPSFARLHSDTTTVVTHPSDSEIRCTQPPRAGQNFQA